MVGIAASVAGPAATAPTAHNANNDNSGTADRQAAPKPSWPK
jgi:hypothetical protein